MAASIEELYKHFGVLADAKDKAGEHEAEFVSILTGVKGDSNQKRLSSQFIARFFKYFPKLSEQALDAQFDLCEDEDVNIRKQAIKDLPALCKDNPEHLPRIADVLTQLLQSDDQTEVSLIHIALVNLFKTDSKGTLGGLFSQILTGDDDTVRERAIKFMGTRLMKLSPELWTKDTEDYMIQETKKVLEDVTGDEFIQFVKILSSFSTMQTLQGRKELVQIVTDQAELKTQFNASDPDNLERLIQCGKEILPFLSKNVHSTEFVSYISKQVLPVFNKLTAHETESSGSGDATNGDAGVIPAGSEVKLDLLKLFGEMAGHCGEIDDVEPVVSNIYDRLIEYMPLPPENEGDKEEEGEPQLQFSEVECLLYAFHQLAKRCPQFLTKEEHADKMKDFKLRLQFFARGVQLYIKHLRAALQGKTGDDLKTEENRIKVMALKTTNNIHVLIKDLMHLPPQYKAIIILSWRPVKKQVSTPPAATAGDKRPSITPISYGGSGGGPSKGPKESKNDRQIYKPPSGKFSEKAGNYSQGEGYGNGYRGGNRGYRGGRGGYRGRGGNRGGRGFRRW